MRNHAAPPTSASASVTGVRDPIGPERTQKSRSSIRSQYQIAVRVNLPWFQHSHRSKIQNFGSALVETIVLDPHGKEGSWCYSVHLKGASESVEIVCRARPQSWRYFKPRLQDVHC